MGSPRVQPLVLPSWTTQSGKTTALWSLLFPGYWWVLAWLAQETQQMESPGSSSLNEVSGLSRDKEQFILSDQTKRIYHD